MTVVVYQLYHEHSGEDEFGDEFEHAKALGIYSSQEKALAAVERYKLQPGFCDYPDGFAIDAVNLDEDSGWAEGFLAIDPEDGAPGEDTELPVVEISRTKN